MNLQALRDRWREPTAVVMTMRDGSKQEEVFATRWLAESFLHQLPYLMMMIPDGDQVASAILSPLRMVDWLPDA